MKTFFTTLLLITIGFTGALWAQPANDNCNGAQNLILGSPPNCPASGSVTNTFAGNNINATPAVPYPAFTGCDIGGSTDSPAAEVWYRFTPNANQLSITITGGLSTPNLVLFTGNDCGFLNAVECASASPGSGALSFNTNVTPGLIYFMLISGGDVDDQGNFNISMVSSRDCSPCLQSVSLVASPPPVNGTYNSGQEVTFCFTINQWTITSTIEWLHSIEVDFGPGWNTSNIITTPPPSCNGLGSWDWYDSWVGCNTGQTFGPGFAYDSGGAGIGCGGSPNDGNPGNNWGDGSAACQNITPANPVTFCWTVTVSNCPPTVTGDDLGITINVWSDGDSGSWTDTGCNSGSEYPFLATAICCDDFNPIATATPTSCPGVCNGTLTFSGQSPTGFGSWNYTVFNSASNIVHQSFSNPGSVTITGLCEDTYTILATNVVTGCNRSVTRIISAGTPPNAMASLLTQPCPGNPFSLLGSTTSPGSPVSYAWTGPGGFTSNQQNPTNATLAGTYSLIVTVAGCPSPPATVNAQFQNVVVIANATPSVVCEGENITLTASGAATYTWMDIATGLPVGSGSPITVTVTEPSTFMVTGTTANGCTGTDEVFVDVDPLPPVSILANGPFCANSMFVLVAGGANSYTWEDGTTTNPRIISRPVGSYTFSVTGVVASTGCQNTAEVQILVAPVPTASITPSAPVICSGQSVTLTASGGNSYAWAGGPSNAVKVVSPTSTTTYTVTVTDFDGCTDVESVTVTVQQPLPAPVISCGIITPNSVQFTWPAVPGATGYQVTGAAGTLSGTTYTVTGLNPGTPVTITVAAQNVGVCGPSTATFTCTSTACQPVGVTIAPVADFCLTASVMPVTLGATVTGGSGGGSGVWSGTGITNTATGIFNPTTAGVGIHPVVYTYTEGICTFSDTLDIDVFAVPTADFSASNTTICTNATTTLTYTGTAGAGATYTWNFGGGTANPGTGQGPQQVSWTTAGTKTITLTVTQNGCMSTVFSQNVIVSAPMATPVITCGAATTTSVTFNWGAVVGASSYNVNVITGQTGTLSGTSFTVAGILPGVPVTIEVIAVGNGPCGNSSAQFTCNAAACPAFNISITPVAGICLNGANTPFDLSTTISGGAGGGVRQWSGPGITNATNGTFNPATAGAGTHTITLTYTEGPCTGTQTTTIDVFNTPTANFMVAPDTVCTNDPSTVTYTGTASPVATYTWNFGGGTANPGTGVGPHTVTWSTSGQKTISLTVTENGCTSPAFNQTVQVDTPLPSPIINCNTTVSTVTFTWADVPGATSYNVTVVTGQTGTITGNSIAFTGLSANEEVHIQVEAVSSGPCANSMAEVSCFALDCPVVALDIDPVADICLNASATSIDLSVQISGGAGGGTSTWSGPGITDAATGVFDPTIAGAGSHTINLNYQEGNCTYNESIVIVINPQPSATFTTTSPVCVDANSAITYTGGGAAGATYDWDFGGGTANPGTGQGPHQVSWSVAGIQTITLTVTENNCASEPATDSVTVEAPLTPFTISCDATNTSITFNWPAVVGATGYQVAITNAPAGTTGTLSGTSYSITGLNPDDEVTIEVTAETNISCGSIVATQTCIANACPPVVLGIAPIAALCADSPVQTLIATATGGAGGGTFTWSGNGVTGNSFDPSAVAPGTTTITVAYSEGVCDFSNTLDLVVNPIPTADFTLDPLICITDIATATYNGTATAAATYNWNFGGGTGTPGTGQGPHDITWATVGQKTVSLTVTENGCTSAPVSQTTQVDAVLLPPVISCVQTTTSVTFSWLDVAGATSYEVTGTTGVLSGNTYTVSGLTPGDMASITVTAIGSSACGNSSADATCTAAACPTVVVTITPIAALCANAGVQILNAAASGGSGGGTFTWSGNGVLNDTFNPASVATGTTTVTVTYTEGVCVYTASADITVNAVPTSDFNVSVSDICTNSPTTITFTGAASPGATFVWDFAGGTTTPGTGAGPHTVSWATGGLKNITLLVQDSGCNSTTTSIPVAVQASLAAPQVVCSATSTNSITFSWDAVAGAESYQVIDVTGPAGTLSGTTYTVTGLTPGQTVEIQVIAVNSGPCGNISNNGSCIAQNCQPLTLTLSGVNTICAGSDASVVFDFNTTIAGPYTISYTLNGGATQTATLNDNGSISLPGLTATTTLNVLSITAANQADCSFPGNASRTITVNPTVNTGTASAPERVCAGAPAVLTLSSLINGEDAGGQWVETSAAPSTGGAFNAATGSFNPTLQTPGTYTFAYRLNAADPCPDQETQVSVIIEPAPVADAGQDQTLTCNLGMATLGGSNTSSGQGITYVWASATPGVIITDPSVRLIEAAQPGSYTLTVTNDLGCTDTDQVEVDANLEVPTATANISQISCFGSNDGTIQIDNVNGGTAPYVFSFNDSPFTAQNFFSGLSPDTYTIVVRDQNGCFSELTLDITQPTQIAVSLTTNLRNSDNLLIEGDSVRLEALFDPAIQLDTIIWKPDSIPSSNSTTIWVSPSEMTRYSVTIVDENGCNASDEVLIVVQKVRPVYISNVFSPNNDGFNDIFYIQAGSQVTNVRKFVVFNRWGESMISLENFQPNDPAYGWDGTFRNQPANAAVFTYFAEIEFNDGEVILYKGDVTLMR